MPSKGSGRTSSFPIPDTFKQITVLEWDTPTISRQIPRSIAKLYSPAMDESDLLRVPFVDQPMAALSSSYFYPSEGEGGAQGSLRLEGKCHSQGGGSRLLRQL